MRARERTFMLSPSILLSRGTRVRVYERVAGSPTTACSLIFADYLKSKSFYLSERMELSNDPAVFQHYIRLTSPYLDSTRLAFPPRLFVDTRAVNVLFAGATRGRRCSASDLSLSVCELRLMTEDVSKYFLICYWYKLQKAFCFANQQIYFHIIHTVETRLRKQSFRVCLFWI